MYKQPNQTTMPTTCKMNSLEFSAALICTFGAFFNNGFDSGHILVKKELNRSSSLNQDTLLTNHLSCARPWGIGILLLFLLLLQHMDK